MRKKGRRLCNYEEVKRYHKSIPEGLKKFAEGEEKPEDICFKKAILLHFVDNAKTKVSLSTKENPEISDDLDKILSLLVKIIII